MRLRVSDAKHRPEGVMEEAAGVRGADNLTQEHKLTLDEAHLILNVKKGEPIDSVLRVSLHAL